jgi:hypothetical protein
MDAAVAIATWVAWTALGLYQGWRRGSADGFELQAGIVRAVVLAMLLLTAVRPRPVGGAAHADAAEHRARLSK